MDLPDTALATLFEFKIDEDGARPKKVNPLSRGMALRYFVALVEGFSARFGGQLHLFNADNSQQADLGMDQEELVVQVAGREVIRVGTRKAWLPPTRIGSRGASWLELCDEKGKVWQVHVVNGQMQLRDGKGTG